MPQQTKALLTEIAASKLLDAQEALAEYKQANDEAIKAGATYEEMAKVKKRLKRMRKRQRRIDAEGKTNHDGYLQGGYEPARKEPQSDDGRYPWSPGAIQQASDGGSNTHSCPGLD